MIKTISAILTAVSCIGVSNASEIGSRNIEPTMECRNDRVKTKAQDLYNNIQNFASDNLKTNVLDQLFGVQRAPKREQITGAQLQNLQTFIINLTQKDVAQQLITIINKTVSAELQLTLEEARQKEKEQECDIYRFFDAYTMEVFFLPESYCYEHITVPEFSRLIKLIEIAEFYSSTDGQATLQAIKTKIKAKVELKYSYNALYAAQANEEVPSPDSFLKQLGRYEPITVAVNQY